ncbi:isocitrate/isopropylmalate dehydrogenase family protein [Roseiconus lacunae]|uniref:Isocitrate/isopropylmalate dehydrogenase family protein n=1 Tax=Roseiconus lacunae TaxID=2605694 RepID=A0ABT7PGV3_9BACT|nr:isocitrate/isopropylmalate dehydrogenase family protein [Roseiconus lacunae]MCD0460439.1 isocitrate/isopropylmalate dehydrogenase family protein [Roseiconus lacunae]MDM4015514.1 isocitrate/isopropylmalate dehydrogenase family protein [Roseiconus lacunae]
MNQYSIAALPGDGIGPECLDATLHVLDRIQSLHSVRLTLDRYEAGAEHFRKHGVALPEDVLRGCLDADAVLLAAIGLPDVRKPDGTEVQPEMMMGLRRALGLYAAVRPVKLYPGVDSPLTTASAGIDMVILRENLEGLFASFGGGCQLNDQLATDTIVITREGTRRVVEYAFELSRRRQGRPSDGRRQVTCVDKANVFRSFAFFRKVFQEIADVNPDVDSNAVYVDAMSLYMVTSPSEWDVLVMENQFGDILSDLGAALVGGLGLGPSAEIGEQHALFQPSHGSAPQLAGKNVANPLATILSAAMMLDWLGHRHDDDNAKQAAQTIEHAVMTVLKERDVRTADLGGTSSTEDVANAVADAIPVTQPSPS